ncbi:hypothetical protein [Burkholderia ubonensis]|uniref:hypothetical protein n=1 Tax=Burkholderia ubonensis TaxID=101571 RepID=UPI0012FB06C0|nr:hypothetical protein [Burkholderia ubonensis]
MKPAMTLCSVSHVVLMTKELPPQLRWLALEFFDGVTKPFERIAERHIFVSKTRSRNRNVPGTTSYSKSHRLPRDVIASRFITINRDVQLPTPVQLVLMFHGGPHSGCRGIVA